MNTMSKQDQIIIDNTANQVVAALNKGVRDLDARTLDGLYDGRRRAVAAVHGQHVGSGLLALRRHPALWGLGLASALLILAWLAMQAGHAPAPAHLDSGDLDIQLLTGELPPQVFADWSLVTQENVEAVCLKDS